MSNLIYWRIEMKGKEMGKAKPKHLKQAGWRIGSTTEFLDLATEEVGLIEMRLESEANPH